MKSATNRAITHIERQKEKQSQYLFNCHQLITSLGTHLSCCVLGNHRNVINHLTTLVEATPATATQGIMTFILIGGVKDVITALYPDLESCAIALGSTIASTVFAFSGQGVRDKLEYSTDLPTAAAGITALFNSAQASQMRYLILDHFGFPMSAAAHRNKRYMVY
ncbi:MAG: hypothetical protein ACRDBF_01845 [Plesiomonas shigelloides]